MPKPDKSLLPPPRKLLIAGLSFLFFVLLISAFFGKKGWLEIYRTGRRQANLKTQVLELREKRETLRRDIQELRTNPGAVEFKARDRLWMMAPDEIVIVK